MLGHATPRESHVPVVVSAVIVLFVFASCCNRWIEPVRGITGIANGWNFCPGTFLSLCLFDI